MSGSDRELGTETESRQDNRRGAAAFLIAGTLALAFLFADVILSVYYYQDTSGSDLRWLLALIDLGLVLSLLSLAGKRLSRTLVSMKLALTLLFVIAIVAIIGTVLPNKDQVISSDWYDSPLYEYYDAIGLFDMYYSRWFLFILLLLMANLSWCIYKRLHMTLKNAFRPRVDVRDSFIGNQQLTATAPGAGIDDFRRAIRGHRYRIHQASSGSVLAQKGRFSALASIAFHLSFIFIGIGSIIGGMLGWSDQLYIPDGDTVDVPRSALQVTNHRFDIEQILIEDERGLIIGSQAVKYSSVLEITEGDTTLAEKEITVNGPLRVGAPGRNGVLNFLGSTSINFHQSAYDVTSDGRYATIIEVNYMPGKLLVYIGFGLMMVGITVALYFPHRRIWAKVGESGELMIGGRTNRARVSFTQEFERIKTELGPAGPREDKDDV